MIGEREKLLSLIAEDPFNLLKQRSASRQGAHNMVLLNNFEEIVSFYEDNKREPADDINNIKEFQLYCRLKQIRKSPDMVKILRDFDYYGLLEGNGIKEMTLDELIHHDPYGLLVDDIDDSIFELTNVRKSSRLAPEYISRREFCRDFEQYEDLFKVIHEELASKKKRLTLYQSKDLIPGRFYVLNGIVLYLKTVDGSVNSYQFDSGERARYDGRTECIFDNGTISHMLYRSLDKALQKDGYSISDASYFNKTEDISSADSECGYVYVLKTTHSKLRNLPDIYKIGSTTTTVAERIKNAKTSSTYLYAGVEVVATFRCYNMPARDLEYALHSFFDNLRLNINIPSENGAIISPREWFNVSLNCITEAISLIMAGQISEYVYDPEVKTIIKRSI